MGGMATVAIRRQRRPVEFTGGSLRAPAVDTPKRARWIALKRRRPITTLCAILAVPQMIQEFPTVPNALSVLKNEIRRLAKREAKADVAKAQKAAAEYRGEIARLKRLLTQREREITLLRKQGGQPHEEDPLAGIRFSAKSVKAQRQRLGLSAADYGKLVGVSGLTVYTWEQGKARPRKAQLAALVALRGISKREAMEKLAAKR